MSGTMEGKEKSVSLKSMTMMTTNEDFSNKERDYKILNNLIL